MKTPKPKHERGAPVVNDVFYDAQIHHEKANSFAFGVCSAMLLAVQDSTRTKRTQESSIQESQNRE